MRRTRRSLVVLLALGLVFSSAPARAHSMKASASGSVTGTLLIGLTTIIDVKVRITNKAQVKRDLECEFIVRRVDTDADVGTGFVGAVVRAGRSKNAHTQVNWLGDATNQFYIEIVHCHLD